MIGSSLISPDIIVGRFFSGFHTKQYQMLFGFSMKGQYKRWYRIDTVTNEAADLFSSTVRILNPDNLTCLIFNTENKRSAQSVCKGTNAFQPAARFFFLKLFFFIIFGSFTDQLCNFHGNTPFVRCK